MAEYIAVRYRRTDGAPLALWVGAESTLRKQTAGIRECGRRITMPVLAERQILQSAGVEDGCALSRDRQNDV
jgi:hypothetical protein